MSKDRAVLEIIEYTDPYCTWCWASEPVLRKISEVYDGQVRIDFVMGGLVKDIKQFYDAANDIGGDNWYASVASHWLEASKRHGMPVDERIWYDIKDEFVSTYPACLAFKAAQIQDDDLAKEFLRKMRESAAAGRKSIHRIEVQARLAEDTGLDSEKFIKDAAGNAANEAFEQDLQQCLSMGVRGYPTFLIKNRDGDQRLMPGYHQYDAMLTIMHDLAKGQLVSIKLTPDEAGIMEFISKYKKVTPKEISVVFDITTDETMKTISILENKNQITIKAAGNGHFISPQQS